MTNKKTRKRNMKGGSIDVKLPDLGRKLPDPGFNPFDVKSESFIPRSKSFSGSPNKYKTYNPNTLKRSLSVGNSSEKRTVPPPPTPRQNLKRSASYISLAPSISNRGQYMSSLNLAGDGGYSVPIQASSSVYMTKKEAKSGNGPISGTKDASYFAPESKLPIGYLQIIRPRSDSIRSNKSTISSSSGEYQNPRKVINTLFTPSANANLSGSNSGSVGSAGVNNLNIKPNPPKPPDTGYMTNIEIRKKPPVVYMTSEELMALRRSNSSKSTGSTSSLSSANSFRRIGSESSIRPRTSSSTSTASTASSVSSFNPPSRTSSFSSINSQSINTNFPGSTSPTSSVRSVNPLSNIPNFPGSASPTKSRNLTNPPINPNFISYPTKTQKIYTPDEIKINKLLQKTKGYNSVLLQNILETAKDKTGIYNENQIKKNIEQIRKGKDQIKKKALEKMEEKLKNQGLDINTLIKLTQNIDNVMTLKKNNLFSPNQKLLNNYKKYRKSMANDHNTLAHSTFENYKINQMLQTMEKQKLGINYQSPMFWSLRSGTASPISGFTSSGVTRKNSLDLMFDERLRKKQIEKERQKQIAEEQAELAEEQAQNSVVSNAATSAANLIKQNQLPYSQNQLPYSTPPPSNFLRRLGNFFTSKTKKVNSGARPQVNQIEYAVDPNQIKDVVESPYSNVTNQNLTSLNLTNLRQASKNTKNTRKARTYSINYNADPVQGVFEPPNYRVVNAIRRGQSAIRRGQRNVLKEAETYPFPKLEINPFLPK